MWRMLAEALAERASTPTTMLSARTTSLIVVSLMACLRPSVGLRWRESCDRVQVCGRKTLFLHPMTEPVATCAAGGTLMKPTQSEAVVGKRPMSDIL